MISFQSVVTQGWELLPVEIQGVRFTRSFPQLVIQGLPSAKTREVRERIMAALRSQGIPLDRARYVLTIKPCLSASCWFENCEATLVLVLLALQGKISPARLAKSKVLGSVALDGSLTAEKDWLRQLRFELNDTEQTVFVSREVQSSLSSLPIELSRVSLVKNLSDLIREKGIPCASAPAAAAPRSKFSSCLFPPSLIFPFLLMVSGGHHALMYGGPGEGKTHAQQFIRLLHTHFSTYTLEQRELAVYREQEPEWLVPVLPQHTTAQIFGSLQPFSLGRISQAQHAVSFWDELPEFSRQQLVALRQVFDSRMVSIAGKNHSEALPADVTIVATANPCPCGAFGKPSCRCTETEVHRYQQRFLGPLAERFHLFLRYPHTGEKLQLPADWAAWHESLSRARDRFSQRRKQLGFPLVRTNAHLDLPLLRKISPLPERWQSLLKDWSLRRQMVFQQVALSCADLYDREPMESDYALAYQYTQVPRIIQT